MIIALDQFHPEVRRVITSNEVALLHRWDFSWGTDAPLINRPEDSSYLASVPDDIYADGKLKVSE